jgi:hypothetical protein
VFSRVMPVCVLPVSTERPHDNVSALSKLYAVLTPFRLYHCHDFARLERNTCTGAPNQAQSVTGKTATFTISILQKLIPFITGKTSSRTLPYPRTCSPDLQSRSRSRQLLGYYKFQLYISPQSNTFRFHSRSICR